MFTELSRDYPGTVPGLSRPFPETSWKFCLCVSLFLEKGQRLNKLDPHPFPGESRKVVYVYSGRKKVYTTTVETLLFSFSGPDLWCILFSLVFPGKWYTP